MKNNFIDVETNTQAYITLLEKITRDNANVKGLIQELISNDFFNTPASAQYHNSIVGGLVDHSLCVYYNLKSLVKNKHLEEYISDESIIIVSLLHDISKMNMFEKTSRNKKVYSSNGSKYDSLGKFDWVTEEAYKVKDVKERFIYGNHEETSEYIVRRYIPLTLEESVAILLHEGGIAFDSTQVNIWERYKRYPLACLLHVANMMAICIDENYDE